VIHYGLKRWTCDQKVPGSVPIHCVVSRGHVGSAEVSIGHFGTRNVLGLKCLSTKQQGVRTLRTWVYKGNRRSGVTLAICHRLCGISTSFNNQSFYGDL